MRCKTIQRYPGVVAGLILSVTWSACRADGVVSGTVDDRGAAVANARMTLFVPSLSAFYEQRTDALGRYVFGPVPNGAYRLGVAARGYDYQEIAVSVPAEGPRDFHVATESEIGAWRIIGNTLPEFFDATDIGILTADGKIFYCHDTQDPILFDPVTGEKSFPNGSPAAQGCMNGTLLKDGCIIMVGGQDSDDPGNFRNAVPWVKAYSFGTDSWAWLPELQHKAGRWYPGLARLADGSLLAMGGGTRPNAERTNTCERFDLDTQTWRYTGSMLNPTEFPPVALLYTGEVLSTWSPPQLYNTDSETWRAAGDFVQSDRGWPGHCDHSLVVLPSGKALAIGVRKGSSNNTAMGEIYDPATDTWSLTSSPDLVRQQTEVVPLPDGKILVAGGETEVKPPPVPDALGIVKWSDLYDPSNDTWRRVADLNWFREYHAVTLLIPDGRVVTTGGTRIKFQIGPTSADIEGYEPPYLFRGVRPSITALSNTRPLRGETLTLTIAPNTRLTGVSLMGCGATTHWVDGGILRQLSLPVTQVGSAVSVTLPVDPNVLPLGHYMVFAMVDDIPSIAWIINVVS